MKKLLGSLMVMVLFSGVVLAVPPHFSETLPSQSPPGSTVMANGYDWTLTTSSPPAQGFSLPILPLSQINTLTPATTGQILVCQDCTTTGICISSGALPGAWVIVTGTGAFVGAGFSGLAHCR